MKILLLEHPRTISSENINDIANAPLSSSLFTGYIASTLGKENNVRIVEGYLEKLSYNQIYETIRDFKPDVIGVHLVYQWKNHIELFDLLERVRNENLAKNIFSYGYYSNFAYGEVFSSTKAIDAIILGEPEIPFLNIINSLKTDRVYDRVEGLATIGPNNKINLNYATAIDDLDEIPFPVRTKGSLSYGEVNIMGSRGCYGGCTFCYINPFIGHKVKWRGRSPENIVAEIDEIIKETGMRYFYFTDPNFFGPGKFGQDRALKLANLLMEKNIDFGIEARVNDIHEDTIKELVNAGLNHILIGLESGREESLKRLNKMTTVEQNENAIRILRKHGINPSIGFIMFEPDSSVDDLRVNFDFLIRNDLLTQLDITVNVLYHHQIILQGTKCYEDLNKTNRLNLSPYSTYEGSADYEQPQIKEFAEIMREITNCIFSYMKIIWEENRYENLVIKENYIKVNKLLIDTFELILKLLEENKEVDKDKIISINKESISILLG
ncbi:radical SAM protein [Alkalibaculum sp. M08DMB]|uniref:Radical SAM protein n=1 Tax=Alkalibaculum sporogenes TaxID=2655001 RepID=A0A6A7KDK2_9FIRM|nr:radical SAM protein [Alkalibaculum sporogenes]MPW27103.1 radical SAM protein [Alkalibaculum sporogenes]